MKYLCVFAFVLVSCGAQSPNSSLSEIAGESEGRNADLPFPVAPNPNMTPGSLCSHPDSYRYREHVAYCERDVTPSTKHQIMENYDVKFGFKVTKMERTLFKIDHYIPLCMGGSNELDNLWPQHETVYKETDPLEQKLCELMYAGRMKQSEAVATIKKAKADYMSAPKILEQL